MRRAVLQIEDIFADLPSLETERLLLRKMRLEDAQDLYEYAADPEVTRYIPWITHTSIEDSKAYLQRVMTAYRNYEVAEWGIVYKPDNKLIGTCGFVEWLPYHARAQCGYTLSRSYWGQGLMTEAVAAVIRFGFQEMLLNRIEARCTPENVGSARVLEKCGMKCEGILREYVYAKGRYEDLKMYSMLRIEWTGNRS